MDVEMQMEANGLPTHFGTASDQPQDQESHVASNLAASRSNAESGATLSADLKQEQSLPHISESFATTVVPRSSETRESPPVTNGISDPTGPPAINGISKVGIVSENSMAFVPDSQPQLVTASPAEPAPPQIALFSAPTSSMTESIIPSSIPPEVGSSAMTTQTSQPILESAPQPMSLLPQAPTSDLRSPPHSDALTTDQVAQVEAQKHQEDNAVESPQLAAPESTIPTMVDDNPVSSMISEGTILQPKMAETGLATPPAQSPPPPPEPEHATLPPSVGSVPVPAVDSEPPIVSRENPVDPAPTPVAAPSAEPMQLDQPMPDAPSPSTRIVREREDDEYEAEPVSKRVKTSEGRDSESTEFKVPEIPTTSANPLSPDQTDGTPPADSGAPDGDDSVTPSRLAHMKKVISNLKKSNASAAFRVPVDHIALNIPSYPEVVKTPMDLGTIDNKLKHNAYSRMSDFRTDFNLIVSNCILFNGTEHGVSQQAVKMQSSFNNQMSNLPRAGTEEPTKEQKKAAKNKIEPTRQAPPRRPSVSTTAVIGSARSPKATPTTPFAVNPDGIPLIRRDSNANDGRPKRAIVPTKRNQDFAGGRPKKKKFELQLRFCQEVLKDIASPKHWQMNQYFTHPVDPVALNIPTYFQIIKKPMDLGTIQTKLDNNVYERAKDFEEDVRLVFKNCYKFNPDGDYVNQCGHQLEDLFSQKWATKDDWIAAREPASDPQTDVEEDDDDQEESDEDGEAESEDERNEKIMALQKQIEAMSKQMGELTQPKKSKKKSKSPSTAPKKSKTKSGKKEKSSATFPNLKKQEKKKSVSKAKPEKDRYVTFAEKQYISNGIAMLPEKQMQEALKIIQQSVPSLANSDQNEIELDIEEVPNHALLKLLNFVKKYAGPPPDEPKPERESYGAPAVGKSKKSGKPMSKHEQEAQIEELKGKLGAYAGPVSPNAVQSIETAGESSDDDGDSEESEEE